MTDVRARRHAGRWAGRADAGSMPMALLVTVIGMALSAVVAPMVLAQISSTRSVQSRSDALHAAQAGLDVALAQMRGARRIAAPTAGSTTPPSYDTGRRDLLPCGSLSGTVAGVGQYTVEIVYLFGNPSTLLTAADPYSAVTTAPGRVPLCLRGHGPNAMPAWAVLFSWGTDRQGRDARYATGARRLQASYQFRTTNENIVGGLIRVRGASGVELCVDAGSAEPEVGTQVTMQPCQPRNGRQSFAYTSSLALVLESSRTPARPLGMCLDAGTPHQVGAVVAVQPCAATKVAAQQWSINDVANFVGTSDGVRLDGYCFNVLAPDAEGSPVVLGHGYPSCNGNYDNKQTFQPDAAVGAGAAGAAIGQLVNFRQFGRCLDVTDLTPDSPYLIAWPCKQAPDASLVAWNQRWILPAVADDPNEADTPKGTGTIVTHTGGVDYCLRNPGSTAYGAYPRVMPCPSGAPEPQFLWTVYGKTRTYATSFQIVAGPPPVPGATPICLAASDPSAQPVEKYDNPGYSGPQISKIVMRSCDGSTAQKWNAPPNLLAASPLRDFAEN